MSYEISLTSTSLFTGKRQDINQNNNSTSFFVQQWYNDAIKVKCFPNAQIDRITTIISLLAYKTQMSIHVLALATNATQDWYNELGKTAILNLQNLAIIYFLSFLQLSSNVGSSRSAYFLIIVLRAVIAKKKKKNWPVIWKQISLNTCTRQTFFSKLTIMFLISP